MGSDKALNLTVSVIKCIIRLVHGYSFEGDNFVPVRSVTDVVSDVTSAVQAYTADVAERVTSAVVPKVPFLQKKL